MKKKKNIFLGIAARILLTAPAGLLLLSCLSVFINPAKAWLLVPLEILFWPLVLLNFALAVWAAVRRSKAILIPLCALIPALFFLGRFIQTKGGEGPEAGKHNVRVVSYNVGRFQTYPDRYTPEACRDSVSAFLRSTQADIICLQEYHLSLQNLRIQDILGTILRGYTPTFYFLTGKNGRFGNVILSRYPLKNKGVIKFDNSVNLAVWADYQISDQTVRVYNCHLESYGISPAGVAGKLFGDDNREVLENTGRKVRNSIGRRASQVDQMFQEMDDSPFVSMICGDFNDSPLSYTYFKTRLGHRDAFKDAGQGFGATYPSTMPFIRLDYIFCPKMMSAVSYDTPQLKFSDHRPVVAHLQFE